MKFNKLLETVLKNSKNKAEKSTHVRSRRELEKI
jgi:hypothetical protein